MKIAIVCDSFKESLSSLEVSRAIERGFRHVFSDADYILRPIADGGEGTMQALVEATDGRFIQSTATHALGHSIKASFGVMGDQKTAIIDMAETAGLASCPSYERRPLQATTYGVGELVRAVLDHGYRHIIMGLGGSATTDGGAGFAQALGVQLLNHEGRPLQPGGGALRELAKIDTSQLDARLQETRLEVACDVTNPLLGERGAATIFGPQKGATSSDIVCLEEGLQHYAALIQREVERDVAHCEGAGAAGGLGAALMAFTSARFRPGIELIAERMQLDQLFKNIDLVVTGEGALDQQTASGKVPVGIARIAKKHGKPVIALVGAVKDGADAVYEEGIDAFFSAVQQPCVLSEALSQAEHHLYHLAQNVARTLRVGTMMSHQESD